jgi:hypothetical protein
MLCQLGLATPAAAQAPAAKTREIPKFEVDPSWPKLPDKWVWGQVSSVSIDEQGHAWILQRPSTVRADQKSKAAPPVLEFDEAGNFVQGWGGPGAGYDWPETEHGIYVDPKGFVWLGGNGRTDHHFTKDGKFVMQIGHKGQSKGNKDTQNVNMAADTFVYAKTNELFVADGYGNKRVIVFDPDTGAFKRMWGAFGNEPLDNVPAPPKVPEDQRIPAKEITGPGPDQFVNPVHAVRVSNDGLVYVSDRGGKRVQVFTLEGKYVNQVFIDRLLRGAALRQRPDRRQHGLLGRSRAAVPLCREPQPRESLGARPQDARTAGFVRTQRRRSRRILRHAPHERRFERQPLRHRSSGRKTNPEVRVQGNRHRAGRPVNRQLV